MEKEIFAGLEEARKDFNSWQGRACIYIDFEDMTAWTRVHELPIYHADSIVSLVDKDDLYGRNDRYGKNELIGIAKSKIKMKKDGYSSSQISDDNWMLYNNYI